MVTCKRLKELLWYTPNTGVFVWITKKGRAKEGDRAGTIRPDGRLQIYVDGKPYLAHRLAWLYVHGTLPAKEMDIDHINRNPLDNRIENLRAVSRAGNIRNSGAMKTNKSGFRGVHFSNRMGKWVAQISTETARIHLGVFDTAEEAAKARHAAEEIYHPTKIDGDKRIEEETNERTA